MYLSKISFCSLDLETLETDLNKEPSGGSCSICLSVPWLDVTNSKGWHRPLTFCQQHTENTCSPIVAETSKIPHISVTDVCICVSCMFLTYWENSTVWSRPPCQRTAFIPPCLCWAKPAGSCQRRCGLWCSLTHTPTGRETHMGHTGELCD